FQSVSERSSTQLSLRVALNVLHHNRDPPHSLALLRTRRHRPSRRTAGKPDEFPPSHSITSSARKRNDGGNVSPSAFAVVRLIASSKAAGCNTGSSDGLAPLRIRPA